MEESKSVQHVIPVFAEELEVSKRQVETGSGVRIHKTVTEQERIVDEPLLVETAQVTRVPMNTVVTAVPPVRHTGDVTIISIVEEQLVIEKKLVLKEEIHIRRSQEVIHRPQTVILLEEHAQIERFGAQPDVVSEPQSAPVGGSVLDRVFPPVATRKSKV